MSIKVNNVSYTYLKKTEQRVLALDNISLEIKKGTITALVGHTGSGKSTLIQLFNALLLPDTGTVEVDDYVITPNKKKNKNIKELRKHIASIFQFPEYQLFEETVEKDVAFGLRNYGVKEDEAIKKAHEALSLVGLDESFYKRSPFELSGGEKRRVAIAGILVLNPEILILDEPTVGLDPAGTKIILDLIKKLHDEGKTIIMVTHDMELVFEYATDVIVLKEGKVAFEGKPEVLFDKNSGDLSLEIPKLYEFLQKLEKRGLGINMPKIRNIDDLIRELKR